MNMEKKSRLGRGLDALLGSGADASQGSRREEIPLNAIEKNPYQPRRNFDEDELTSLQDSIRNHGILQPVVVRQVNPDRYELIAGERRLRAAEAVGLTAIPVSVVNFNDQQSFEAALVENIQRSDLNPIEKAQGFKDYLARYQMTHEQLAQRLGMGRATITNLVSLLDLPQELQDSVRVGQLTLGHAKILKGVGDGDRQKSLAREIIARGLSVHATEAFLKQNAPEARTVKADDESDDSSSGVEKTAHVQGIEDELKQKLGLKVEIRLKAPDRGQITLRFESNDDFERAVEALRR